MRLQSLWSASALALVCTVAFAKAESPLTPEQALQSFETPNDLTVELVAAEPLTASPCAMAFDERGRLFVAENRGYPRGSGEGKPAAGVIAMLEDTDGDGRMDKRTVFADQLEFPNGVIPWKGGLIVTSSPDLIYFRDTDGDGRADERRVLLTGFDTTKSTQLRVNGPTLGLDGWIWLASGLSGGKVMNLEHPEFGSLDLKSDLRFDPESGRFEAVDGRSQYGHSFDDFGRRFICMNRIQVQHVVMSANALRRNPNLAFSDTVQNCPDLVPNPLLRGGSGAARIFPISSNITTADSHAGTFSAACAVTIWRGGALPESYVGCAFSCDPTGNLVHVDRLEPRGATFAATSLLKEREFLASRDDWFRPVFVTSGPDGALYVCDMYRKVIEHPDYLPEEVRKHTDFEAGKDLGRIWRVSRKGTHAQRATFEGGESPQELFTKLASDNGWERQTAFRLLTGLAAYWGTPVSARAFRAAVNPAQTVAILAWLHQNRMLDKATLSAALRHSDAGVREFALRIAPANIDITKLAQDEDARVRFQCALALGEVHGDERARALAEIARRDSGDRWTRAAILSSSSGVEESVLQILLQNNPAPGLTIVHDLTQTLGKRVPSDRRTATLEQLLTSAASASKEVAIAAAAGFADSPGALPKPATIQLLDETVTEAARLASGAGSPQARMFAIDLLGFTSFEVAGHALITALDSADPQVQTGAVRSLARLQDRQSVEALLDPKRWNQLPPAVREAVLTAVLSRPRLIPVLLDSLENHLLPTNAIDSLRRQQLQKHADRGIRERATKLLAQPASGDRQKAFESAKAALALAPHPANGREVFRKLCATCHRIEREGVAVGPDLFDIRNQPKESILLHIVVPEHEIAPGFSAYVLEMKDGRTLAGIISSETPESITLRQPGGQEETISRTSISALTSSPLSLMPQGLERVMSNQEMSDLIAYLRGEQ
ncbi:PVC-type heme-binding CxxCH protein [Verrucomicrobiota bacterium sgz303538]